jgi:chromosome partitioning protein
VDCPPSLGLLTVNAMVATSEVLIPIQCEYYALEGLGQLLKNIDLVQQHLNPQVHVSTILLTMYDARTKLADQVAEEVRTHSATPCCVRASHAASASARHRLRAVGRHVRPGVARCAVVRRGCA